MLLICHFLALCNYVKCLVKNFLTGFVQSQNGNLGEPVCVCMDEGQFSKSPSLENISKWFKKLKA